MARSVGEAAALGLESGFVLGRNTVEQMREGQRRDELARATIEDRQMQRAMQQETLARQRNQDRIAAAQRIVQANDQEQAADAGEVTRLRDAGVPVPATFKADIINRAERRRQENAKAWSLLRGDPVSPDSKEASFSPSEFMPGPNGEPPARAKAALQVAQAVQSGDVQAALPGLNVIHGPSVQKIIGRPSKHGGTIIGAEIVGLMPAPGSKPDDPQYIPTLKITVGNDDGNPIGEYFAPATKDGSTEDDAPVLKFGVKDQAKLLDENMKLVQALSSPEGQARYKQVLAQIGVVEPKPVVKEYTIPQGAKHVTERRNPVTGELIDEHVTEGNPKATGSIGSLAQTVNAVKAMVESGDLSEAEGKERIDAAVAKATTGTKAQGLAAGGGSGASGGAGGSGLSKDEERRIKAEQKAIDRRADDIRAKREAINKEFDDDKPAKLSVMDSMDEKAAAAHKQAMTDAKKKRDAANAKLDAEEKALRDRQDRIEARLDGDPGLSLGSAKGSPPAGKQVVKALPAGAKQIGTSGGKPVYETPDGKRFIAK
jgi:hypothetical protein